MPIDTPTRIVCPACGYYAGEARRGAVVWWRKCRKCGQLFLWERGREGGITIKTEKGKGRGDENLC